MNSSIYNGSSALLSVQKALDVESHNTSNVNTVGYKSDSVSFQDMMYSRNNVGMGSNMPDVTKNFNQGLLKYSGFNYDFGIQGEGFFTVIDPRNKQQEFYTRAGNFQMGEDSYLQNATEKRVLGLIPKITGQPITKEYNQQIATVTFEDKNVAISINTFATQYQKTAHSTGSSGDNNKSTDENLADIEALSKAYEYALFNYGRKLEPGTPASTHKETMQFDLELSKSGEYTPEITINGRKFQQNFVESPENTLKLLSDQVNGYAGITSSVDEKGILTIESMVAGQDVNITNVLLNKGALDTEVISTGQGSGSNLVDALFNMIKTKVEAQGGEIASIQSEITKTQSANKPDLKEILLDLKAQKLSDDEFGTLENDGGNIYLTQGQAKFLVGRLEPVVFNHMESMRPEGGNLYTSTEESGSPIYRTGKGEIKNKYLEVSNNNLAEGLVNLMVLQKSFDANSKTVTTSDELLKTALQLRK